MAKLTCTCCERTRDERFFDPMTDDEVREELAEGESWPVKGLGAIFPGDPGYAERFAAMKIPTSCRDCCEETRPPDWALGPRNDFAHNQYSCGWLARHLTRRTEAAYARQFRIVSGGAPGLGKRR